MKKAVVILVIALVCIGLCGCSDIGNLQDPKWEMTTIQDKSGKVICCKEEKKNMYADAEVRELICDFDETKFYIDDVSLSNQYEGNYILLDSDENGKFYSLMVDNVEKGIMVFSITKSVTKEDVKTVIMTLGNFVLYFEAIK